MSNAKYRVGMTLKLIGRSGEVCGARIVDAYRPGNKKNSHMYRIELWPSDGSVEVEFMETANLTHAIAAAAAAERTYRVAYACGNGNWEIVETFVAANDADANAYAEANYSNRLSPSNDEWYVLDGSGRNINGGE